MINKKLLFTLASFLFVIFIIFSYLVAKETFTQLDFDLTVKFQDKIPKRFDLLFSWFSVMGSYQITGTIWVLTLLITAFKKFWTTTAALILLPLALAIEVFGKMFVHHPAPPFLFYRGVLDVNLPLDLVQDLYSYPSGHETRTAFLIIFLLCYFFFRKTGTSQFIAYLVLMFYLTIMTISRIYLGEHWTTDVVGGFLIGASFGLFAGITIPKKLVANNSSAL